MPIRSQFRPKQLRTLAFAAALLGLASPTAAQSVLTYHGRPDRSGNFVMPALSWDAARAASLDIRFATTSAALRLSASLIGLQGDLTTLISLSFGMLACSL